MTNTLLLAGPRRRPRRSSSSVKRGVYAKRFSGGQVNISNGDFVFSLTESYLIEDGKLTAPLKGVNLIGNGPGRAAQGDHARQRLRAVATGSGPAARTASPCRSGVGTPTVKIARDHRRRDPDRMSATERNAAPLPDAEACQRIAEQMLSLALKAGADGAEVLVRDGSELAVKVRLGEPELVQEAGSRALGLRVLKDQRAAVTYTSRLQRRRRSSAWRRDASSWPRWPSPTDSAALPDARAAGPRACPSSTCGRRRSPALDVRRGDAPGPSAARRRR